MMCLSFFRVFGPISTESSCSPLRLTMRKEAEWVLHAANTVSAASVHMALRIIASGNDYHIFSISFFFLQRSIDLE